LSPKVKKQISPLDFFAFDPKRRSKSATTTGRQKRRSWMMASVIENPMYACFSSREAADVVSRGRVATEIAAQAWTRMSERRSITVAILLAKREASKLARLRLKNLV